MSIATLHQQPGSSTGVAGRCEKLVALSVLGGSESNGPPGAASRRWLSALSTIPVSPPPVAHSVPVITGHSDSRPYSCTPVHSSTGGTVQLSASPGPVGYRLQDNVGLRAPCTVSSY